MEQEFFALFSLPVLSRFRVAQAVFFCAEFCRSLFDILFFINNFLIGDTFFSRYLRDFCMILLDSGKDNSTNYI